MTDKRMISPEAATTPLLGQSLVEDAITRAVNNVCSTMIGHDALMTGHSREPLPESSDEGPYVIGSVGFVGEINGIIYLCLPDDFAKFATKETLGMNDLELMEGGNEMISDTIGELTNMTVGGFKNALCDQGHPCKLTLPTIIRARKLCTGTSRDGSRIVYHFECHGHEFAADIQVRIDESG